MSNVEIVTIRDCTLGGPRSVFARAFSAVPTLHSTQERFSAANTLFCICCADSAGAALISPVQRRHFPQGARRIPPRFFADTTGKNPTQTMLSWVSASWHNRKIFWAVVVSHSILMMNYLVGPKRSSQHRLGHDLVLTSSTVIPPYLRAKNHISAIDGFATAKIWIGASDSVSLVHVQSYTPAYRMYIQNAF